MYNKLILCKKMKRTRWMKDDCHALLLMLCWQCICSVLLGSRSNMEPLTNFPIDSPSLLADDALFGWDSTPGIVSVWASRIGKVWVWQRIGDRVRCTRETFRPWLFATTLDDLAHLGSALQPEEYQAEVSYRTLDGPDGSYRYLLSSQDGRMLERTLLNGASRRLNRRITSLSALGDTY
jgi:DNA polymerase, archaea type